ncbi:hypothetical protein [Bacillus sp. SM2101]|uniref:hypothetical protein n=1 Tax=Bacillus sp. SM2101 TaxID=2805366 RepID=UPI002032B84E|nr:hypothetical protein [Bacillus sp. SM2101]
MSVNYPQIEESGLTQYIPPKEEYNTFENDEHYEELGREWGLFGKTPKKDFWYKGKGYKRSVKVVGFIEYGVTGTFHTLIIKFEDGNISCIHPDYLKEMQKSTFGKETEESPVPVKSSPKKDKSLTSTTKPKNKSTNEKATKSEIALPEDKVTFVATVKGFGTKPNPFSDNDDEILLLDNVKITADKQLEVGFAWCGYSKTLKKLELQEGQSLEFSAKIVKKKHKEFPYKINNPSKIKVQ